MRHGHLSDGLELLHSVVHIRATLVGGVRVLAVRLAEHALLDWLLGTLGASCRALAKMLAPIGFATVLTFLSGRSGVIVALLVVVGASIPAAFSVLSRKPEAPIRSDSHARWLSLSAAMESTLDAQLRQDRDYWVQELATSAANSIERRAARVRVAAIRDIHRREFERRLRSGEILCRGFSYPYRAEAAEIDFVPALWERTIALNFNSEEIRRVQDEYVVASCLRFRLLEF